MVVVVEVVDDVVVLVDVVPDAVEVVLVVEVDVVPPQSSGQLLSFS